MNIKFKKTNPNAVTPKYARIGDAGLDLTAISEELNSNYIEFDTGIAVEIPPGFLGLVLPRSSISNTNMTLSNSIGLIDSSFRGAIKFRFRHVPGISNPRYKVGDRIGQLLIIPYPNIELIEVDELNETDRGSQGYGSTNNGQIKTENT